jgi:hypothetical protein
MDWLLIGVVSAVLAVLLGIWIYRSRRREADDLRAAARVNSDAERSKHNWFY